MDIKSISIVDLGCGVGHGCFTLAEIPDAQLLGVDNSAESLEYAKTHYSKPNITYLRNDLTKFIPGMSECDYVVSRGVLEHVPNGLDLAFASKRRGRLLFDVPYAEPKGTNPHHIIHDINEDSFARIDGIEFFFQDLQGNIFDAKHKPENANMIICALSNPNLAPISEIINFPIIASKPGSITWLDSEKVTSEAVKKAIPSKIVLDVGAGIRPQQFFTPAIHIIVEPFLPYITKLRETAPPISISHRVYLNSLWSDAMKLLPDKSVDTVFAIDVIEHLDKENGHLFLAEAERVARCQIIIFTPLGMYPQSYEKNKTDRWGMQGGYWQSHRSGWEPSEFKDGWDVLACKDFHLVDQHDNKLDEPQGAFWAMKTVSCEPVSSAERLYIPEMAITDIAKHLILTIKSRVPTKTLNLISKIAKKLSKS